MSLMTDERLVMRLVEIAREAGRAILEVYESDFGVAFKEDRSPLTEADRRSHGIIERRLREAAPDIPLISEEGKEIPYEERREWKNFYLVDPLDGTKEFISRNGEFTVNIALIRETRPVLGIIVVPVDGMAYFAIDEEGAYKQSGTGAPERLAVRSRRPDEGLTVVASRSHASPELEDFLRPLDINETVSRGSSLKFCIIAEGKADLYPRLGQTWEWDTAAGHCIVEEAGGRVLDRNMKPLLYNKRTLKHDGFIVLGDLNKHWIPL
jgi:3'(2'), 5'-bisphosphate nucleotidase